MFLVILLTFPNTVMYVFYEEQVKGLRKLETIKLRARL